MLLEFLFGLIFLGENSAFQFAVGLNEKTEIRTNDSINSFYSSQDTVQSLDYDIENNLLVGGDKKKYIFIISINTSIYREKEMEKDCSECVISINKTHLVAGCDKSIIFFNKSDLNEYDEILSEDFGNVKSMILVKKEKMLLIGSDQGYITIFNLENLNHVKNNRIADKILAIDALDRDFVVSQCNQKCVCSFEINQTNYLVEKKKLHFDKEIKVIRIINKDQVVFGGDTFLYLWILQNSSKLSFDVKNKVWGLDVFSFIIIASGHENGQVNFWNVTNQKSYFSLNVGSNVHCLESLTNFSLPNGSLDTNLNMNSQFTSNLLTEIESTSIYQTMSTHDSSDTLDISTESQIDKMVYNTIPQLSFESTTEHLTEKSNITSERFFSSDNNQEVFHSTSLKTENSEENQKKFGNSPAETNGVSGEFTTGGFVQENDDNYKNTEKVSSEIPNYSSFPKKEQTINQHFQEETTKLNFVNNSEDTNLIIPTVSNYFSSNKYTLEHSLPDLNAEELTKLLSLKFDLNDCLINCSGNGMCKFIQNKKFICECFVNFVGSNCQINTLPCASNPCLNNGTCLNNLENKTFTCRCDSQNNQLSLYYGKNCEKKIDVCSNETCSKQGVCYDIDGKAKCKCFPSYSGEKCEIESSEMMVKKVVVKTSAIIAIVVIVSFFALCLACDLLSVFSTRKKKTCKKTKTEKLIYVN